MAKKKQKARALDSNGSPIPVEWIVLAVLAVAYIALWLRNEGFYQHDEVAHFLDARGFWNNPASILGYWNRPGFKIVYVVPALLGRSATALVTIGVSLAAAYAAMLTAREMGIRNAVASMVFCGFQPIFYQISFRTYSEPLAALIFILGLLMFVKGKLRWSAFLCGYLFTVRQEFALIALLLAIVILIKRDWIALVLLGIAPLILAVLGWIKSGDPTWIVTKFLPVGAYDVMKPGFFHYWNTFPAIFGLLISVMFLVGFFGFAGAGNPRSYLLRYAPLYVSFSVLFLLHSLLVSQFIKSPSPGHFRYLMYLAPAVAIFANLGLNHLTRPQKLGTANVAVFLGSVLIVAAFGTYKHNYFTLGSERNVPVLAAFCLSLVVLAVLRLLKVRSTVLVLAAMVLVAGFTLVTEQPFPLDDESREIKEVADWYMQQDFDDRTLLCNHPLFFYYTDLSQTPPDGRFPKLQPDILQEAPVGSIILWDSHYGYYRSTDRGVKIDFFRGNEDYRLLQQFTTENRRFGVLVLEKVK